MTAMLRFVAALLVALLVPLQGYAAACAQICAAAGNGHGGTQAPVAAAHEGEGHCHGEPAGTTEEPGAPGLGGKCCQAHVFTVDFSAAISGSAPPLVVEPAFVARWTSFIPDEPSPPPIRPAAQS
jgi:hypothetical protein